MVGAVLVVGAGISGMQSALDLAEMGYKVYIVEKTPAIGGRMPMLDKTFPTNDCSMCILSPKLVECGRHRNIEILTLSEVVDFQGEPGNYQVTVKKHSRFVDTDKCLGCGSCVEKCPVKVEDDFNQKMGKRKAIYKLYPQAYPNAYVIDQSKCLKLKNPKACGKCLDACPVDAINHDMKDENVEIHVGAVIICSGYDLFDAELRGEFGYGLYPNVITSLQFERMLSASGPYRGHVQRPSDGGEVKKVGFIQCVGSRDIAKNQGYCSSVCCMYATKEAVIAKEHVPGLETTIFCMDVRAYGKDFEKYYNRAKDDYQVRYIKSMVSSVKENPLNNSLRLQYRTPEGGIFEEEFDIVVLSVGLKPTRELSDLSRIMDIPVNNYNFCELKPLSGVESMRPGIFLAGVSSGPKDIPETVMQASAAAGDCSSFLAPERNTLVSERTFPEQKDVLGEEPRIGVFVCHCGINIGSVVNVPSVVEFSKTLPNVTYAQEGLYVCSQDSQATMKEIIKEHNLNRIVVASCSPRTHKPLFQETMRDAGLNKHLFEMANIRDQCSWVHQAEHDKATDKSKDLVKMAVYKSATLAPINSIVVDVNPSCLVLGGGVAG
ncbi:MAG: 4Fe-4S binding protein, partial [Desulfocucumaceae bacterium]